MKAPTKEQLLSDILSDATWDEIARKYGYSDSRFLRKLARRYDLPKRRVILRPTETELRRMILDDGLTPYQVADKLGYGEGGWANIYKYCRDYGIEFDFSPNYKLRAVPFTQRQKDIAVASLLGDGYLRHSQNSESASYSLSFTHGEKQIEYLKWKLSEFENFVVTKDFYRRESTSGLGHAPTYSFSTITHPYLSELYSICFKNGKKCVTREWLDLLSPLSLAVWYMDDGSFDKHSKALSIATNAFSREEQLLMIDYFSSTWGFSAKLERSHKDQTIIRINASQRYRFFEVVSPHVPSCMAYKLG